MPHQHQVSSCAVATQNIGQAGSNPTRSTAQRSTSAKSAGSQPWVHQFHHLHDYMPTSTQSAAAQWVHITLPKRPPAPHQQQHSGHTQPTHNSVQMPPATTHNTVHMSTSTTSSAARKVHMRPFECPPAPRSLEFIHDLFRFLAINLCLLLSCAVGTHNSGRMSTSAMSAAAQRRRSGYEHCQPHVDWHQFSICIAAASRHNFHKSTRCSSHGQRCARVTHHNNTIPDSRRIVTTSL
jgi:hypothetical protein